jgi:hypothetical protein
VQRPGCKARQPASAGSAAFAAQAHFAQRSEGPQGRAGATKPKRRAQQPGREDSRTR